jgi:purine-binding chemotaxis protein CheW
MSLRRRFGFEDDVFTPKTRILILKPEPQASIGFIVDEVKEVINIKEEEIDRVVTSEDKNTFIAGVGKHTKGLVSILNISAVLQDKEQD